MKKQAKLCYVLPVYDEEAWGNSQHKYRFVEKLALSLDIFLIFESGKGKVRIANVNTIVKQRFTRKPWSQVELFLVLLRARISGYRLFYSHFSIRPALYAKIITFLSGGKVFLFHCAEFAKKDLTDSFFEKARFYWVLKHVDRLVTTTPRMARHYTNEFGVRPDKIKLVPNWADIDRFSGLDKTESRKKIGVDSSRKISLFVHQLSRSKGAHHIPRIAQKVREKIPETMFLVVGGPGTANDVSHILKNEVVKNGLEDLIRLEGKVPNKDIQSYFSAADLFIMPSDEEGFGIVLLEAMASGLPFVATDGGGPVMDVVSSRQSEFVVPAGDMDAFCQKTIHLLTSERERTALVEEGKRHVRRYSIDEVSKIFEHVIISDDEGR